MLWKLLRAGLWLILPLIVLEVILIGVLFYLGLNPEEGAEFFKQARELAETILTALIGVGTSFWQLVGLGPSLSRQLASYSALVVILFCYALVGWLIFRFWRFEMRVYKKLAQLWRDRKAAPS